MVHSPNRDLILASLPPVEYDPSHELKRQMFKDAKVDTKKRQNETACNPMDTMFNILRRTKIHVNDFLPILAQVRSTMPLENGC